MSEPDISLGCVSNVWVRQMKFKKAGDVEQGHTHTFDHLTLLTNGKIKVTVNNEETVYAAPHMILILKNFEHKLEALEDNTLAYCVHAIRTKDQSDIIDPSMIPMGAAMFKNLGAIRGDLQENPTLSPNDKLLPGSLGYKQ